jgi:esterase/lipase
LKAIKPSILLLHGALGSSKTFESFIPILSNSFEVFSFDFRGHGIYSEDETINAELLCEQLIKHIEITGLQRVTVFGYSMGGYIALMSCIKRPDLFGKIITLATKFDWNNDISNHEIEELEKVTNLSSEHPFKIQLALYHLEKNIPRCVKSVGHLMVDLGQNKYLNSTTISMINNKVLLLLGELDTMVTSAETIFVLNHLQHGQFINIPNTRHPFEKVNEIELLKLLCKNR